jgi:hypothetical protein
MKTFPVPARNGWQVIGRMLPEIAAEIAVEIVAGKGAVVTGRAVAGRAVPLLVRPGRMLKLREAVAAR